MIGSLWANDTEYGREAETAIGGDPQIDLVAIMKAERCTERYVLKKEHQEHHPWRHPIYWLLWVGWEDGIAYRKGVAEIHRSFWDAQALESVSLVLG